MQSNLEREWKSQPAALARLLAEQGPRRDEFARLLRRDDILYILIASRGSSLNAARYAQYLLGRAQRVPVVLATPSLYTVYGQPPKLSGALVVGISQSGASPDVVSVLEEARRQHRPTISLTNDPDSALGRAGDVVLPLSAGEEVAVAATKTYVNSLGGIALLFSAIDGPTARRQLDEMPERVEEQIALSEDTGPLLEEYADMAGATVVARGVNYGTAFEIALKIRELSGLLVEAYSSADLLHGPIAAIGPGWPVILVAPSGPALESVVGLASQLAARGARVIAISDADAVLASARTAVALVAGVPEWLSPLVSVIPGQLAGIRLAQMRNCDIDQPAGLTKITLTR